MKNNEDKLFSSISEIDDNILDSALAYKPEKAEIRGRTISIKKKITAIALAAVMCMGLVVTVSAYGEGIWAAITQRKRELIDDKSQIFNKTVTAESGCSLTVDNVAGGFYYFSIHSGNEPFTNGLKYERLQVMYKTSPELNITYPHGEEAGDWYTIYDNASTDPMRIFFADLERIDYDSQNPTSTVQYKLTASENYSTTYKIIVTGVTSEDGSIKYADELSVEFDVDRSKMQSISAIENHKPNPEIEFELDGIKYQLYSVSMFDPYHFNVFITNKDENVIDYKGKQYYAVCRFWSDSWYTKDWVDGLIEEQTIVWKHPEIFRGGASDEVMAEYNAASKKRRENQNYTALSICSFGIDENGNRYLIINEDEAYSMCYDLNIELFPDCGASVKPREIGDFNNNLGIAPLSDYETDPDYTFDIGKGFEFTSPIYITDIKRIYVTKNSDPDFELTIYEPRKDLSLFESQNAE